MVHFDSNGEVSEILEKPTKSESNSVVTGLYVYDNSVIQKAKSLQPSPRGELEITDLNNLYLCEKNLHVKRFKGAWFDTGTFESLFLASAFIRQKNL